MPEANLNTFDQAFASMIEQSEKIISCGRPAVAFDQLLPKPQPKPRLECELRSIAPVDPAYDELSERQIQSYQPLIDELLRFEPQSIMFSAIEPGQGVTFTAHNLARLFSQKGSTLLLELYNGRSGLTYDLPTVQARSIATNPQSLEQHIRRCGDLYLLSAHVPGAGAFTGGVLKRLKASFDYIIIDCAPYWHNILAPRLAPLVDGVAMIASHKPQDHVIKRFYDELDSSGARFMGLLMNAQ